MVEPPAAMSPHLTEMLAAHYRQKARTALPLLVVMFLCLIAAAAVVWIQEVPELTKEAPAYEKIEARLHKGDYIPEAPLGCQYPDLDTAAKYQQCVDEEKMSVAKMAGLMVTLPSLGFLSFLIYYLFQQRSVQRTGLYRLFAHQRDRIVWVYQVETNVRVGGVGPAPLLRWTSDCRPGVGYA